MIRPMLISFGRASISIVPQHPAGSVSDLGTADLNHDPPHVDFVWSRVNFDCSTTPSRIGIRAEALENQCDARPTFFAGRSAWDFSKRDTHFCLYKALSLSRTLHFHRSFPLVYRDRLAISYRDHVHHVGRFAELSDQETTARSGAECGFHFS